MSDIEAGERPTRDGTSTGPASGVVDADGDGTTGSDPESSERPGGVGTESHPVAWTWRTLLLVGAATWLGSALVVLQAAQWLGYADESMETTVLVVSQVVALVATALAIRYLRSLD